MAGTPPLLLLASVSAHERRMVEAMLKTSGFTILAVGTAQDAETALRTDGTPGVLVIDSGLLEAPRDAQWRELRTRHPQLGAAVRCRISRENGVERRDRGTLLVHPEDDEGLRGAVSALASMALRSAVRTSPTPSGARVGIRSADVA